MCQLSSPLKSLMFLPVRFPSLTRGPLPYHRKSGVFIRNHSSINLQSHIFHCFRSVQHHKAVIIHFPSSIGQDSSFLTATTGHTLSYHFPSSSLLMTGYSTPMTHFHSLSPTFTHHDPSQSPLSTTVRYPLVSLEPMATPHHFICPARSVVDSPSKSWS
jgi:hypothetical protein